MFNLGMGEITLVLVLALIFLGPKKLPELATGLGRLIRQIRKATSDVKNEIVLDDSFRKPFEELRDAVTLSPEELKRRDQIKQSIEDVRRRAEELEREQQAQAAQALAAADAEAPATPLPEPLASVSLVDPEAMSAPPSMAPPAPPPPVPAPPNGPPIGTFPRTSPTPFPRSPTPAPLSPGRITGPQRVTPPISSLDSNRANITQVLSEEDLLPAKRGAPPPPPPLPGMPQPPPLPGTKKG